MLIFKIGISVHDTQLKTMINELITSLIVINKKFFNYWRYIMTNKKTAANKLTRRHAARYVDGFVLSVPKRKLAAYRLLSRKMGKIMKESGVLEYRECVADDMKFAMGVTFPKLVKPKSTEVVIFSWISFKSKAQRNSINKKIMKDPRVAKMCDMQNMPFECKRMTYGGFKVLVDVG